jgi:DNA processing protein
MTPGIGGKSVSRVMARNRLLQRSPTEFLALSDDALRSEYRLTAKAVAGFRAGLDRRVEETLELEARLDGLRVHLVTSADANYPARVEEMDPDAPGVLFLYGNTGLLQSQTFSVLASRNTRPADLDLVETLTEEAVLRGEVLVCGHDRPEYQRAAIVPLRWGSPRILVLDRGLFKVLGDDLRSEAFRAARLWRYEFDPNTDLVVSPFRPHADFIGINNKVRDRLVTSLSARLDFVNVAQGGNMDRLIRLALQCGRRVRISDRVLGYREYVQLGAETIR